MGNHDASMNLLLKVKPSEISNGTQMDECTMINAADTIENSLEENTTLPYVNYKVSDNQFFDQDNSLTSQELDNHIDKSFVNL